MLSGLIHEEAHPGSSDGAEYFFKNIEARGLYSHADPNHYYTLFEKSASSNRGGTSASNNSIIINSKLIMSFPTGLKESAYITFKQSK